MNKILVICLYDYPYIANSYILNDDGTVELNIDAKDYDYDNFSWVGDNQLVQTSAKKFLDNYVDAEEATDVNRILVIVDGSLRYFGKRW